MNHTRTYHQLGHVVKKVYLKHSCHASKAKLSRSAGLTLITRQYSTTTNPNESAAKNSKEYSYKNYCLDEVRKKDYEHFFNALLYSKNVREANIALRAFNIEIATIKDIVSKPEIGLMRMNFWKDTIKNIYKGEVPELPVAKALSDAVNNYKLTRGWFTRLLDARERDIMTQQPRTLSDVEEYAEQTSSSLYYLSLETMGVKNVNADHVASHIGKAYGLTTLLRGIPFHASRKQIYLPMDLTTKHGVSTEQYFRGEIANKLIDVVYEIANVAKAHLDHSRELKKDVPKQAFPAFLPSVWIDDYLDRLQEANFNPFDQKVIQIHRHPRLGAKLKVAKNYYLNQY